MKAECDWPVSPEEAWAISKANTTPQMCLFHFRDSGLNSLWQRFVIGEILDQHTLFYNLFKHNTANPCQGPRSSGISLIKCGFGDLYIFYTRNIFLDYHIFKSVCVCVCVCVHKDHSTHVEVRGQLLGTGSLPSTLWVQGLKHRSLVFLQLLLSSEPFCWPLTSNNHK